MTRLTATASSVTHHFPHRLGHVDQQQICYSCIIILPIPASYGDNRHRVAKKESGVIPLDAISKLRWQWYGGGVISLDGGRQPVLLHLLSVFMRLSCSALYKLHANRVQCLQEKTVCNAILKFQVNLIYNSKKRLYSETAEINNVSQLGLQRDVK